MFKKSFTQNMLFMIIDAAVIFVSFYLAYYIRFDVLIESMPGYIPDFYEYFRMVIFVLILWIALLKILGVYDKKISAFVDEAALITWGIFLGLILFVGLLYIYQEFWFSRQVLVYAAGISLLGILVLRMIYSSIICLLHLKGVWIQNILIVGAGDIGQAISQKSIYNPELGYRVIGFLDNDPKYSGKIFNGIPVLGKIGDLNQVLSEKKIDEIIIADSNLPSEKVLHIITEAEKRPITFKIVPGLLEIMASRVDTDEIGGIPLVSISSVQWHGFKAVIKRSFDLTVSSISMVILSPVFLLIALAIRVDSPGQIVFSQPRVGKDGKVFNAYKFRSMIVNAEHVLKSIEHLSDTKGHIFKMKDDPRVTKVGRFIRRFSLDELPQLFNVWFGDMSVVGPRPPLTREVKKYNDWQLKRLRIAPGLTGLWQVSGRSQLPFDDMVRLDIYYIENWSLWLDFKIILRTIPAVLFGSGAY